MLRRWVVLQDNLASSTELITALTKHGLTLEKSALETETGAQFTLFIPLIRPYYLVFYVNFSKELCQRIYSI